MAVWRWWGDGGCEAARRSATLAAASRKCEPRAAGGQSRAGAVTAAGVRWCWPRIDVGQLALEEAEVGLGRRPREVG